MSKHSYNSSIFLANTAKLNERWSFTITKTQLIIIHTKVAEVLEKFKKTLFETNGEIICYETLPNIDKKKPGFRLDNRHLNKEQKRIFAVKELIKHLKTFVQNPFSDIYFAFMEKYLLENQNIDPFLKNYVNKICLLDIIEDHAQLKQTNNIGYNIQLQFANKVLEECIFNKDELLNNPDISVKGFYLIVAKSREFLARSCLQNNFELSEKEPLQGKLASLTQDLKEENAFGQMRPIYFKYKDKTYVTSIQDEKRNLSNFKDTNEDLDPSVSNIFCTPIHKQYGPYKDQFEYINEKLKLVISKIKDFEHILSAQQEHINGPNYLKLFSHEQLKQFAIKTEGGYAFETILMKQIKKDLICKEFLQDNYKIEIYVYPDLLKQQYPKLFQTKFYISVKDQYTDHLTRFRFCYPLNEEINLLHTSSEDLESIFDILQQNYKLKDILKLDLKKPDEKQKFITNTGSLYYYLAQMAPCSRGGALIAHMFVSSIFLAKGLDLPNFKALDMEINPDIMAMLIPVDEFISKYFAKVVENAIKPSSITNSATAQKLEKKNELH